MMANADGNAETEFWEQNSTDEDAVLRAWLGLNVSALSYTDHFFGNAEQCPELIQPAEAALENKSLTTSEQMFWLFRNISRFGAA